MWIKSINLKGKEGNIGLSAYDYWRNAGNIGSIEDFLLSLKGEKGETVKGDRGDNGLSSYEIWKKKGNKGSEQDFLDSLKGNDGISIDNAEINEDGELLLTKSNGELFNLGVIKGGNSDLSNHWATWGYSNFKVVSPLVFPEPHDQLHIDIEALAEDLTPYFPTTASFSGITSGTNNIATMVVDTGASISVSGSGTIEATSAPAGNLTGTTLNSSVVTSSLTSLGIQAQALNMNSHKINNVTDPSNAQDAATKNYVDLAINGLSPKTSVRLATAAALAANTYNNGTSGVGATLTGNSVGVLTVDGQSVVLDDRILVKNESSGLKNGIYKCTTQGTAGVAYVLTRTTDSDTSAELVGAYVYVEAGTTNTTTTWAISNTSTITIGTTAITVVQISGPGTYTAGTGLNLNGNQFAIADTGVAGATYGSATQSISLILNDQGQATSATSVTITPAVGSITGLGTGVATALGINIGTTGAIVTTGSTPVFTGGLYGTSSSQNYFLSNSTTVQISDNRSGSNIFAGTSAFMFDNTAAANGSFIALNRSRSSTIGSHSAVGVNDRMGLIQFGGSDGTSFVRGSSIVGLVDGTVSTGIMPGRIEFQTMDSGGTITTRQILDSRGNKIFGTAALSTSATDGFIYTPTCAGAPSGTPTAYTGVTPLVYDTTNNTLNVYNSGWKSFNDSTATVDATNVAITNDTTTNATMYPTWVTTTSGNVPVKVSSSKFTFNPSTGLITSTAYTGSLAGSTGLPISTGVSGLGTGVATFLATPSSANLAAAVTDETGTGALVFGTSPTFTTQITSPTAIFTGAANSYLGYSGNTGSSFTIDPANGTTFYLTLNSATPTLTLASAPSSTVSKSLLVMLIQDGTGGRAPTFSNVTWVAGAAPAINQTASQTTLLQFDAINGVWYGIAAPLGTGVSDGTNAGTGYPGEVQSSSVAIGAATSLTTATAKTITSITLTAGDWIIYGNIGFIAAGTTVPTKLTGSISTTTNTQATSPNDGAFAQLELPFTTGSTNVMPVGQMRVNITSTTTYYLVATATFTVSTLTAYGSINAIRSCRTT